jgi:hypothetical protein
MMAKQVGVARLASQLESKEGGKIGNDEKAMSKVQDMGGT